MEEENRPDPAQLLAAVQRREESTRRGHLKIFLGMCPGVGKTYTMLESARKKRDEGVDVVVGVVETHGRPETELLLHGLEVLPKRRVEYRGVALYEMDLDALLHRRPRLAIVDEFAHTNAPDSRHPKRWQDVIELLNAGIDVHTTLNVQHVESRKDEVHQVTGVAIRESVPDSMIDRADEIELVDLTPALLADRLREGKVYMGEVAVHAADHFFREENLSALREMALRLTAERVQRDLFDTVSARRDAGPWKAGDRLMVAVGPSPSSEKLVRIARRTAGALNASWLAVHVDTGEILNEDDHRRLANNLTLARTLGADVISTAGADLVDTLLRVARQQAVTRIVAGKPLHRSWWRRWLKRSVMDRLVSQSGQIEIHLIHPGLHGESQFRPVRRHANVPWAEFGWALLILAAVSAVGHIVDTYLGHRTVPLFYLVTVIWASVFLSRGPVMMLAAGSALAWNYFYTHPRFTFQITSFEDMLMFALFFIVAIATGHLTSRLRARERAGIEGERRAQALYDLSKTLVTGRSLDEIIRSAVEEIERVFRARVGLLRSEDNGLSLLPHPSGHVQPSDKELTVAIWSLQNRQWAGRQTDTLAASEYTHVPLMSGGKIWGVLAVRLADSRRWDPVQQNLMDSFAALLATALEKDDVMRRSEAARVAVESQKLQRALLDNFSHEMKTPLAVLAGSIQRLRQTATAGTACEILDEASDAVSRLCMVVGQMVDLTRLESGLIRPSLEWCEARDLLREWLGDQSDRAVTHHLNIALPEEPVYIHVDAYLLTTAMDNILANALRHAPAGTDIDVALRRSGTTAIIRIADRGPGIAEGETEKIFQRFYRGFGAKSGGLGLGLSIAREFVELLGGTLSAGSREAPSGGACFSVAIPCKTELELPVSIEEAKP